MKSTGMIRKIDNLGRIVLPMELRKKYGLYEGVPLEIFVTGEGIVLKRYLPGETVQAILECLENVAAEGDPEQFLEIEPYITKIKEILYQQEERDGKRRIFGSIQKRH